MDKLKEYDTDDGFHVVIGKEDDDSPDLSYLGEYTSKVPDLPYYDRALERVITERTADDDWNDEDAAKVERFDRRSHRYIAAGTGDPEYIEQDAKRLEGYGERWSCVGVVARVYREGVKLAESALWGIETDSDASYFEQVGSDVADEALTEAKATLAKLCKDRNRTRIVKAEPGHVCDWSQPGNRAYTCGRPATWCEAASLMPEFYCDEHKPQR